MDKKLTAWSFSRLKGFETCPKKFYHTSVAKTIKEAESEQMRYGKRVHKALEVRVRDGKKLPMDLSHLEPICKSVIQSKGIKIVEQQMALTKDFTPTGWFDSNVWVRAILDLGVIHKTKAALFDWKTGRPDDDFTQMNMSGAVFLLHEPEIKEVTLSYYWLKNKSMTSQTLLREEAKGVWAELLPRVNKYQKAHDDQNFPPRPGFLCKKWCPVKECPYHGV